MSLSNRIRNELLSDSEDDSQQLTNLYREAPTEGRELMDMAFIALCGWSLTTMLDEEAKEEADFCGYVLHHHSADSPGVYFVEDGGRDDAPAVFPTIWQAWEHVKEQNGINLTVD